MSDSRATVECEEHGFSDETYVCQHLAKGNAIGFNSREPSPDNPRPDAWCDACEEIRARFGDWTEDAEILTKIVLLCGGCYDVAKHRNHHEKKALDQDVSE